MGKLRKKLALGIFQKINFIFSIILSFAFAALLGYKAYFKPYGTNKDIFLKCGFYFFMILAIVFLFAFIISSVLSLNIALYDNGIYFISDKEMLEYRDIISFYFIPFDYLIVLTKYNSKLVFKKSRVGEDFFYHFQKDYVNSILKDYEDMLKDKKTVEFGIIKPEQLGIYKFLKFKFLMKNLKFKEKISLDSNGINIEKQHYDYNSIKLLYDIKKNSISIMQKSGQTLYESDLYYVEKTHLLPELLEKLIQSHEEQEDETLNPINDIV